MRTAKGWTKDEDIYVINRMLNGIAVQLPQTKIIKQVAERLGRTERAVKFRWETRLKVQCAGDLDQLRPTAKYMHRQPRIGTFKLGR